MYGVFFSLGEAVHFRDCFHSTSRIFECTESDLVVDSYCVKLKKGLDSLR